MNTIIFIWLCFAPNFFISAGCSYTTIKTKQHQVVFHYPNERRSEKDLPICGNESACSVLHKRHWLPPVADRLCRCSNNEECPWRWTSDNQTMILNNRAQFKFCTPIAILSNCNAHKTALKTRLMSSGDSKPIFDVNINCFCPFGYKWQHFKTIEHLSAVNSSSEVIEEYKCVSLKRCRSLEFCGNVRSDYNSLYYHCACPLRHLCINKSNAKDNVEELLYKGGAYHAICEPDDPNVDYDYGDY